MEIEQLFLQLLDLSRALTAEEARHVREQLSEEELVVFDLLTRPGPTSPLPSATRLRRSRASSSPSCGDLTIDWQKTAQSRARVRDAIEEALDDGLPRAYTPDVFKQKAGVVFQHVYERYGRVAEQSTVLSDAHLGRSWRTGRQSAQPFSRHIASAPTWLSARNLGFHSPTSKR